MHAVNITLRNRQHEMRLCQPYCNQTQFKRLPESKNALLLTRGELFVNLNQLHNGEPTCTAACGPEEPFRTVTDARTGFQACAALCPTLAYDEEQNCVDACAGLYVTAGKQRMCVDACPESHPYRNGAECVKSCGGTRPYHSEDEDGTKTCAGECGGFVDETGGILACVRTCARARFQNACVLECPDNTFLQEGVCVSRCDAGYALD